MAAEHPCESSSWVKADLGLWFAKALSECVQPEFEHEWQNWEEKTDEAPGIKDERPIPTQCNPNQASSITPTITSTIFGSSFFRLQFHFGSQPWQLWQSRWEPVGSTCKLDYTTMTFSDFAVKYHWDNMGLARRNRSLVETKKCRPLGCLWTLAGQSCCVFRYLRMLPRLAIADFITEFVLRTVAKSARFGGAS